MGLTAQLVQSEPVGYFRIYARPKGGRKREITFFRGAATKVNQIRTADPFTDISLSLTFPQVTVFDTLGEGDLNWMIPDADIDVVWENTGEGQYDWTFEGFLVSPTFASSESDSSVTWEVKGALLAGDNYLAPPTFPAQPIPYELLMQDAFDQTKRPAGLGPFSIEWPRDFPFFTNLPIPGNEIPLEDLPGAEPAPEDPDGESPPPSGPPGPNDVDKIMVFMYENHGFNQVNKGMPFMKSLGKRFALCTDHRAATHPSLPNYLQIASGQRLASSNKSPGSLKLNNKNVFGQTIIEGKKTAKCYMDGMQSNGATSDGGNKYAVRHNPWVYFVKDKAYNAKFNVPLKTNFYQDSINGRFPNVAMVTPNLINGAHDGSLAGADAWTKSQWKTIENSKDWKAGKLLVIFTWDEDNHKEGNRVYTVCCHPALKGKVVGTRITHNSLSRAMSHVGRSTPLGDARTAPDLLKLLGLKVAGSSTAAAAATPASTTTTLATPIPEEPADTAPQLVEGETWGRRVPAAGDDYNRAFRYAYLRPWGVVPGQLWTGFTTRSTGAWEKLVTGYVQGLLSVMFEEAGAQWTIRKDKGRKPVLYLREIPQENDPNILEVDVGAHGVTLNLSRDFTQSANTIFGEGQDDAGTVFSNAQVHVTDKGPFTSYEPFAYQPSVWPVEPQDGNGRGNPDRNVNLTPREAHIKFPQGMDLTDAKSLARAQLHRFTDPGITGTVQLKTDPRLASGEPFPRLLVKAGRSIRLKGLFGLPGGVLVHITETSMETDEMVLNMTVDSKFRDQLTVAEVRARTRDALTPLRSLQIGKYSNTVQDLLFPWSYELGSGILPSGGPQDATQFFKNVAAGDRFPYEEITRLFPPRTHSSYYIKVPKNPDRQDATKSWTPVSIPIRMSAAGSIRLSQVAAYDADGNVLPVKFHLSIYTQKSVSAQDMPILIGNSTAERDFKYRYLKPPGLPEESYSVGQRYPFYETAWEQVNDLGEQFAEGEFNRYPSNAGLVVGWGNFFEPAGYSPGRFSRGAPVSGLLVDEVNWSWDVTSLLNQQKASDNTTNPDYGRLYVMIYCDDVADQDIYFMGRFFRTEPGVS